MISLRPFTAADVPLGMRLKAQAGWNQLEADWERMLDMQPGGGFVAEYAGTPCGTVMTCMFGDIAWIAMMLVDESVRGQGIGRALMEHALAYLGEQEVRTVRLDATPLGQPLYESLGFVAEYSLARYAGIPASSGSQFAEFAGSLATALDYEGICACDRETTRTDRRKYLSRLMRERPAYVVGEGGVVAAFLMTRAGAKATQIGPCVGQRDCALQLLRITLQNCEVEKSPVYVDVPLPQEPAAEMAASFGLTVQRRLLRMRRGPPVPECVDRLWASSGPELG